MNDDMIAQAEEVDAIDVLCAGVCMQFSVS